MSNEVKEVKEVEFRFACIDRYDNFRIYCIRGFSARNALVDLISQVVKPSLEMAADSSWYWSSSAFSSLDYIRGSWNDLCAWCVSIKG